MPLSMALMAKNQRTSRRSWRWSILIFLLATTRTLAFVTRSGTLSIVSPRDGARFSLAPGAEKRSVALVMEAHASQDLMTLLALQCCISFGAVGDAAAAFAAVHCFGERRADLSLDNVAVGRYVVRAEMRRSSGSAETVVGDSVTSTFEVVVPHPFVASYTYQVVDEWQEPISSGLEVRLPLDGHSQKTARIPPIWRLQLSLGTVPGFARVDVSPTTAVHTIREAVAKAATDSLVHRWAAKNAANASDAPQFPPLSSHSILLVLGRTRTLRDDETVGTLDLFHQRSKLKVWYAEGLPLGE